MKLTKKANLIRPSVTIKIADKARELERRGEKVIKLQIAESHLSTPDIVKSVTVKALYKDKTHYSYKGVQKIKEFYPNRARG